MTCIVCDKDDDLRKMHVSDIDENIDVKSTYLICRNCFTGSQWLWDESEQFDTTENEDAFNNILKKFLHLRLSRE